MVTLYGSSVANGTLTTACTMASATGGTETSKTTTYASGTGFDFGEIYSQGGTTVTPVSALTTPSGHGWVYSPGAGTFANANWSASITLAAASFSGISAVVRFYKYSGGTYTSIGTISANLTAAAKTTYSFAATSMPSTTFAASDLLYVDLFLNDTGGVFGDNPVIYESTSATQGVANDMQVTTSNFTASATHLLICDGYGGVFS